MNYERSYYHLFNAITDALSAIRQGDVLRGIDILKKAQLQTETWYIEENQIEKTE